MRLKKSLNWAQDLWQKQETRFEEERLRKEARLKRAEECI
jgi:hypothetical protein